MGRHRSLAVALSFSGILINPAIADAKAFKNFQGRECNKDYKRLCPTTPIGKCDLQSMIDQLSPQCKAYVEKHR